MPDKMIPATKKPAVIKSYSKGRRLVQVHCEKCPNVFSAKVRVGKAARARCPECGSLNDVFVRVHFVDM